MPYQEHKEANLNSPDDRVAAHEVGQRIEMRPAIIIKYLCIDIAMHYQEYNQEQTRSTHEELPADVGGKSSFPIHKWGNDVVMTAQR